ncbi:8498_t:CDS:2 [Funneliformis caledonium]|uniref:8498_t:CDS:1 n=1 Tax=Funneliformis caledonium TaxID=1117310 RepID=A0A9N8ZK54_9GLOM|nr:8498_t:CDS:2 [Funneliformis caledonium]
MSRIRPQVAPSAFEIRFSTTDSQGLEVFEIQPDLNPQERVPDPFKKRDKIPRSSGIINSEQSSPDSPIIMIRPKSKHYLGTDNNLNNGPLKKGMSSISNGIDQASSIKSKSWNAVGPEDKSQQRTSKNLNGDRFHLHGNVNNEMGMNASSWLEIKMLEDDSIIRNAPSTQKKRPFRETPITNLNGKTGVVNSKNKKKSQKNTPKTKKINMPTNNYKDEEIKSVPKDGIATPPDTPPQSPPISPNTPLSHLDDGLITPRKLEEPPITPPLSSGSSTFNVDVRSAQPLLKKLKKESPIDSLDQPKKVIIPHDDVIVPTVAKKLKMNGQLHFANHDALLDCREDSESISPTIAPENGYVDITDQMVDLIVNSQKKTENGYVDITDQVEDLFDNPQKKSHKRQPSLPDSQRRRPRSTRKNSSAGHSRNSSTAHYIAPRKQNHQQPAQITSKGPPSPTITQFEDSSNPSFHNDDVKRERKSRREEYIMSVSLTPSEPSTAPTTTEVESHQEEYTENKVEEILIPAPVQMPAVEYNPYPVYPVQVDSVPVVTKGKEKKNKKQKKNSADSDDEEKYIRKARCRCMIQ